MVFGNDWGPVVCAAFSVLLAAEAVGATSAGGIFAGMGGTIWAGPDMVDCDDTVTPKPVTLPDTEPDWDMTLTSSMVLSCWPAGFGEDGLIWTGLDAAGRVVVGCSG